MNRNDYTHEVTKTYPHSLGLSCCYRQWRAESHCRHLHGYALEFAITFRCSILDERGWVIDFGALKPIKAFLQDRFDHTLLVEADDPYRKQLEALELEKDGPARVFIWNERISCESFARQTLRWTNTWLQKEKQEHWERQVRAIRCGVREHGGNQVEVTWHPLMPVVPA